jgi:hypothetical protein
VEYPCRLVNLEVLSLLSSGENILFKFGVLEKLLIDNGSIFAG